MTLTRRQARWIIICILAVTAIPLLVNLGRISISNVHEARVAGTARNMLLDRPAEMPDGSRPNPWIVPNFNGQPRLKKTPLPYWAVAASALVWQRLDEWSARMPSVLLGLLGIWVTYRAARLLTNRGAAILSAVVLATTFKYLIEARSARVDIYLAVSLALAMWFAIAALRTRRKQLLYFTAFWVALGITWLAKYPLGPFLVLPVVGMYILWQRRWSALFNWRHLPGLVLFAVITLGWFVAVDRQINCGLRVWWDEVWLHVASPGGERSQPWWYYLPRLFVVTFPWSAFVPPAILLVFLKDFRSEVKRLAIPFLWVCWCVLVCSLSAKKKADYLLPMLPAAAILIGRLWFFPVESLHTRYREGMHRLLVGISMTMVIATGISIGAIGLLWTNTIPAVAVATGAGIVLAGAAGFWLFWRRRGPASFALAATGAYLAAMAIFLYYLPIADQRISPVPFVEAVRAKVGPDARLVFYGGYRDVTMIYHWGKPIGRVPPRALAQAPAHTYFITDERVFSEEAKGLFDVLLEQANFRDVRVPGVGAFGKPGWKVYLLAKPSADMNQETLTQD